MIHDLESDIEKVTVYQGGARITRIGTINLEHGEQTIRIPKLTEFLDKESVRVKGTGYGTIVNVTVEKHASKEGKNARKEELQTKLKTLKENLGYYKQDFDQLTRKKNRIQEFSDTFYQRMPVYYGRHGLELQKIQEMESHMMAQEEELIEKERKLEKEQQDLLEQINIIQRELNQFGRANRVKQFYEIKVNLKVSKACEFKFIVEFQLHQASWQPFYDINLGENTAHVKLLADVINNTGEDWTDIQLEISSASIKPVKVLKPNPLVVREYIPRPRMEQKSKKRRVAMKPMAMKLESAEEMDFGMIGGGPPAPAPPPKMNQQMAKIDESLGTASYKLPTRLNIPADSNPHPVTLMETELNTEKGYFWSVAAQDQIIVQDTLTNKDLLLLPGNAKVYYEGEYIGESSIPLIAPQETIKLGTRRTYDLKIERGLTDRKRAKEGFLKGKISKHYSYEIKIQNLKEKPYPLTIMDHMVHSDSEKIKILNEKFSLEPKEKKLGVLTWEIPLKEVKEMNLAYEYEVVWEKETQITPALP